MYDNIFVRILYRSEANDLALEICNVITSGSEILVLEGAYHGHTQSLLSLSSYKIKQQRDATRIKPNPHAWFVSVVLLLATYKEQDLVVGSAHFQIPIEGSTLAKMQVNAMLKKLKKLL